MIDDLDTLRRRAERAYARWRAYDAQRPLNQAPDEECVRLKNELDLAEDAVRRVRQQHLSKR
ncbi:MAG: hypothetical protein ABI628_11665 [Chloroflexota bacterium]